MIAYFDTSALVPLLVDEQTTDRARALWVDTSRPVSVLLVYAEVHAALARARRAGRLDQKAWAGAVEVFERIYAEFDAVDAEPALVRRAAALASSNGLRGYDAVHLAAAERLGDADMLFVSGDRALCRAARDIGLQVSEL